MGAAVWGADWTVFAHMRCFSIVGIPRTECQEVVGLPLTSNALQLQGGMILIGDQKSIQYVEDVNTVLPGTGTMSEPLGTTKEMKATTAKHRLQLVPPVHTA